MDDRTVKIGSYTSKSLKLILHSVVIGTPDAKTNEVEVPGTDSVLDLTEVFGKTYYKKRKITMGFWIDPTAYSSTNTPITLHSNVCSKWHGKKLNIIFASNDSEHYVGRLSVGDLQQNGSFWGFTVVADAEPYKYDSDGDKTTI